LPGRARNGTDAAILDQQIGWKGIRARAIPDHGISKHHSCHDIIL
jgi:hypothetical protein